MKIDLNSIARRVEVDNRIPLRNYYRIAYNLLKQASIYREEENVVDLYIILVRYSSLVSETIPYHQDYQVLHPKERTISKKKLVSVLDELESLKPEFQRRVDELNRAHSGARFPQLEGPELTSFSSETSSLEWPTHAKNSYSSIDTNWPASMEPRSTWTYGNGHSQVSSSNSMQIERQFQKLSLSLPPPKKETLSRHLFFGTNGLQGQWLGPSAEIKVQYPSNMDSTAIDNSGSLNQAGQSALVAAKDGDPGCISSPMESVRLLDDGRWLRPVEESCSPLVDNARKDHFQLVKQPSIPPVLAQLQQEVAPIPPARVADPRPGPAKSSQDGMPSSSSYQHLHIPVRMMEDFLRLAQANTKKNYETCGVLAGSLKNRVFHITTLIIPKQESTSDSCQALNEEEIFEVQDKLSLFPLGWIHTHPSQTCFMSSVDLHTHYPYQIMLPEAIAIVMAPTDTSSPHGIFHLSDPGGVSVLRNCQQRGFHPHEEPSDGSPIYEHCSHVYMNSHLKFDVVDLR